MNLILTSFSALYSSKVTWTGVENIVYLLLVYATQRMVRMRDLIRRNPEVGEKAIREYFCLSRQLTGEGLELINKSRVIKGIIY